MSDEKIFAGYDTSAHGEDYSCLTLCNRNGKGGIEIKLILYGHQADVVAEAINQRDREIERLREALKEAGCE